jgi:hypothetical protein
MARKIVYFFQVWNEKTWVESALNQAFMIGDQVVVSEGSNFDGSVSTDGTSSIIELYDRIPTLFHSNHESGNYRENQAANYNEALAMCNVGDVFVFIDADEFLTMNTIAELKRWARTAPLGEALWVPGEARIWKPSIGFCLTTPNTDISITHRPIAVVKSKDTRFIPTHKLLGITKTTRLGEARYIHFQYVKPRDRLLFRQETSRTPSMKEFIAELTEKHPFANQTSALSPCGKYLFSAQNTTIHFSDCPALEGNLAVEGDLCVQEL